MSNHEPYVPRQTKIIEIAEMLADEAARQKGFKKGGPRWEKEKHLYLKEYRGELSADISGRNEKKNPRKVRNRNKTHITRIRDYTADRKSRYKKNPSMSSVSKEILGDKFKEKRLLSLVTQINNYYFEDMLGKKVRGKSSDDNQTYVSFPKNASQGEIKEVYINRYRKDLFMALTTAMLVKLFSFEENDMDVMLEKIGVTNSEIKELAKKENKKQFSEALYSYFLTKLSEVNLMEKFKE